MRLRIHRETLKGHNLVILSLLGITLLAAVSIHFIGGVSAANTPPHEETTQGKSEVEQTPIQKSSLTVAPNGRAVSMTNLFQSGPDWVFESDTDGLFYGWCTASAGDVNGDGYSDLITSADGYTNGESLEGAAFLFLGSSSGLGTTYVWSTEGNQASASYGEQVGLAGDINNDGYGDVFVTAWEYDNGESSEGRIYLYNGSASGLSTVPDWIYEPNEANNQLGRGTNYMGLDANGDGFSDFLVANFRYSNGENREGATFLFFGSSSGLGSIPDWQHESNVDTGNHGQAISTAGDVNGDGYDDILTGTLNYSNGESSEGLAEVFYGSASGPSTLPDWRYESDVVDDDVGRSLGFAGDVNGDGYSDILVGSDIPTSGRVRLFLGSATGPAAIPDQIFDAATYSASSFGITTYDRLLGTAGDVNADGFADVIIGATSTDNPEFNEGSAYLFLGTPSGLNPTPIWSDEGNQISANFGDSAGTAGDVNGDGFSDFLVTSTGYDNGESNEGRIYVYYGEGSVPATNVGWTSEGQQVNAEFGNSAASAGDINGDGYTDVIVGAPGFSNGEGSEGRASVYLGTASGPTTVTWTAESDQENAEFGNSVASAGDVNGDGFEDVLVGAELYNNGYGRAYLYLGSAAGPDSSADWIADGEMSIGRHGSSVASAGDVNADGFGDVIVAAQNLANGESGEGRVYVYFGSPSGLEPSAHWTHESDEADAQFGSAVASAGDVNADGFSDIIVGSWGADGSFPPKGGAAYVYLGSSSGVESTAFWSVFSDYNGALVGDSVACAGDVNGDGYSDVIVGAEGYNNGELWEGRAYAFHGSASGPSAVADWVTEGDLANAYHGSHVASAGDVNGDGFSDVVIGARRYSNGQTEEGRAILYLGSSSGLSPVPDWTVEGDKAFAFLGFSTGMAGDVNGDGFSDVIAGAPNYSNGESGEGAALLYYGNGGKGLWMRPGQAQPPGALTRIGPLGASKSETDFKILFRGRTPWGRDKLKLQWEVEPIGTAFSPLPLVGGETPFYVDTGVSGSPIKGHVSGLSDSTPYHWRARLLYEPGNPFGQVASRWLSPPFNAPNETDLQTKKIYPFPSLSSVLPTSASQVGGTFFTISGTDLRPGAEAYIGPFLATGLSVAGDGTSLSGFTAPGTAGTYDVVVVNPDGKSDTLVDAFTYIPDYIDYTVSSGTGNTGDGWGTAWGDFDKDGDDDLFVANSGLNVLYANDGSGSFTDVTVAAGVGGGAADNSRGCSFIDFNNDGWPDIYVVNASGVANKLYKNDMDGTFTDISASAGVDDTGSGMGCAWADIDKDGDLDLFVSNVGADKLYESAVDSASETFTDITAAAGISDTASGQGCTFADYDKDGDQDLYVCNIGWQNFLWENDGTGSFTEVAASLGVAVWGHSFGAVWGDTDNDGDMDLYVTTSTGNLFFESQATQAGGGGPTPSIDWVFLDRSFYSGLDDGWSGRGATAGDWNNDGHLDLYLVNANYSPPASRAPVASSNKMFQNNGDQTFLDVTTEAGVGDTRAGTAGAAGDLEQDGFLDIYVVNLDHDADTFDAENIMFRNLGNGGHWLTIKLVGTTSNADGVGAVVEVHAERGSIPYTQTRVITAGSGFLTQDSLALEFGLGTDTAVEVTVTWPSGIVDTRSVVPVDRVITIAEGSAEFGTPPVEDKLRKKPGPTLSKDS